MFRIILTEDATGHEHTIEVPGEDEETVRADTEARAVGWTITSIEALP